MFRQAVLVIPRRLFVGISLVWFS